MLAAAQGPGIRRSSLMRYKTLWEGSNQAQADGLLAWERVLRAQAQPGTATGFMPPHEPVSKKSDSRSESASDTELEHLTRQFRRLQNDIRTTLEDNEGPRPLLPRDAKDAVSVQPSPELQLRPPAVEPTRTLKEIGRQFAGLRDSLRGCVESAKPTSEPMPVRQALTASSSSGSPSSIPVPRRDPGFTSDLKPRLPSSGGAYRRSPAADGAELPNPALFRGEEPSMFGGAEPPAELSHLAVRSLRGVEQILAAGEARRAAAEAEAGAPRGDRGSFTAAARGPTPMLACGVLPRSH